MVTMLWLASLYHHEAGTRTSTLRVEHPNSIIPAIHWYRSFVVTQEENFGSRQKSQAQRPTKSRSDSIIQ